MKRRRRVSTRELERRLCRRLLDDGKITSFDIEAVVKRLRMFAVGYGFFDATCSIEAVSARESVAGMCPAEVQRALRFYVREWRRR